MFWSRISYFFVLIKFFFLEYVWITIEEGKEKKGKEREERENW